MVPHHVTMEIAKAEVAPALFPGPAIQIHPSVNGQDQQNQNAHLLIYNKSSHVFILADQLKNMILGKHIEVRISVTTKFK